MLSYLNRKKLWLGVICLLVISAVVLYQHLKPFTIYEQSTKMLRKGFGNCDIGTNGESLLMQRFLKPGHIVFDVGANKGNWSFPALQAEPRIRLLSFEPLEPVYEILKNLLADYPNVETFQCALDEQNGKSSFFYYPKISEMSGFYNRKILHDLEAQEITVKTEKLDDFCSNRKISRIDFLKIDTEGAEWKVLNGAKGLIANHQIRAIQFEYGGTYLDAKITLEQVMKFLTKNQYVIFRILPKGLLHISKWEPSMENYKLSNYIAIYKDDFPGYVLTKFPAPAH